MQVLVLPRSPSGKRRAVGHAWGLCPTTDLAAACPPSPPTDFTLAVTLNCQVYSLLTSYYVTDHRARRGRRNPPAYVRTRSRHGPVVGEFRALSPGSQSRLPTCRLISRLIAKSPDSVAASRTSLQDISITSLILPRACATLQELDSELSKDEL